VHLFSPIETAGSKSNHHGPTSMSGSGVPLTWFVVFRF